MDISYNLVKFLHLIFMTTWMAGLFYLPRIFVYHSSAKIKTDKYDTFTIMEKKLFKYIMTPSLVLTWVLGLALAILIEVHSEIWFSIKFVLVFFLTLYHIYCGKIVVNFEKLQNKKSANFFRVFNEIPTILFILVVFLVIFKPFN